MKISFKKVFTLVLALALAFGAFAVSPLTVNATEGDVKVYDTYSYDDFATLIGGHNAPVKTGYLFAGWYKDASDTDAILTSDDVGEETSVYAKFIRADMSRVCCQLDFTNEESPSTRKMRVVSIIDSTRYKAVGFNIYMRSAISGKEASQILYNPENLNTKVYSSLKKYDSKDNYSSHKPDDVFGADAEGYKFVTAQISGVPAKHYASPMIAKPYWVTLDGTYVEGLGEFNRVNDEKDEIVNVSVNTKQALAIAAGMLTVNYDSANFEYVGADYGRVFSKMDFYDDGNGKVKCLGIVSDVSANSANPNDVFVNLRFHKTVAYNLDMGGASFASTVSENSFCDIDEELSSVSVPTIKY